MSSSTTAETESLDYYVPHAARWPIVGSISLFTLFIGFANWLNGHAMGQPIFFVGVALLVFMMYRWFAEVANESESGKYNAQVDTSFRLSMGWFIFSEVMFFGAFFGALFYARWFSGPWLGGEGGGGADVTNALLYPLHDHVWPTNGPEAVGGPYEVMGWFGLPLINTLILLTSGVTCTLAHHAIREGKRQPFIMWLAATVALGFIFVVCQAFEYYEAYAHMNLKLSTGIYGSTFFMLTGFHGFHVTMGAVILLFVMLRAMRGHFSKENHFAFEAAAWYWHFVDVVWLGLFLFVYIF